MQRLFELSAIDFVGREIVAGDVFNPEVAHDDIGNCFGFQFALLSVFGDDIGLLLLLVEKFMGELMGDYARLGRCREAGADDDATAGRIAFDARFFDFVVVESDVEIFFGDLF